MTSGTEPPPRTEGASWSWTTTPSMRCCRRSSDARDHGDLPRRVGRRRVRQRERALLRPPEEMPGGLQGARSLLRPRHDGRRQGRERATRVLGERVGRGLRPSLIQLHGRRHVLREGREGAGVSPRPLRKEAADRRQAARRRVEAGGHGDQDEDLVRREEPRPPEGLRRPDRDQDKGGRQMGVAALLRRRPPRW